MIMGDWGGVAGFAALRLRRAAAIIYRRRAKRPILAD
jgi:hypothetical protein